MLLAGAIAYLAVFAIGYVLERVAKLPVLGTINGVLGAVVGLGKALVFIWIVLYVALWFPLSGDFRADLHRSALASVITQPNERLDGAIRNIVPLVPAPLHEGRVREAQGISAASRLMATRKYRHH